MTTIQRACLGVLTVAIGSQFARAAAWDGGTPASPNSSGDWSVATNWADDALPTIGTAVSLPAVTGGATRITDQDIAGLSIASLTITQDNTNSTSTNVLSLSENLITAALTTTRGTSVTPDKLRLDLNGKSMTMSATYTVSGTTNFNSAGSQMGISTGVANTTQTFSGDVNVTADGRITRNVTGTSQSGTLGVTFANATTVDITGGTLVIDYTGNHSFDVDHLIVNNGTSAATAVMTIASNAGLSLKYAITNANNDTTNNSDFVPILNNPGTVSHGGLISFQAGRKGTPVTPTTSTVNNTGTWRLTGTAANPAGFQRLAVALDTASTGYLAVPVLNNNTNAVLVGNVGNGGENVVEFDEAVDSNSRMLINNNATIAPGAVSAVTTDLSSVGTMTLRDIDVTFSATGKLNIDVGGTTSGAYDVLNLANGLVDGAGAGTLDLSAVGDTLNVRLVNTSTFTPPPGGFSIPILTYGSRTGAFDLLTINGDASQNAATYNDGTGTYSVQYNANGANLVYAVPEPTSIAMLALGGLALLRRSRRQQSAS